MKNLTDFRKTVETGVDRPLMLINTYTSLRRKVSNFVWINLVKSSSKYLPITYLLQLGTEKSDINNSENHLSWHSPCAKM